MESEMNESFGQPHESQSQPGAGSPPEHKPTSQQSSSIQQTFLNLSLSTWIKCVVISIILSVAAVFIAPEFSTAQSGQPQQTVQPGQQETFNSPCEYEEDMYDYSQYNDGWNDDYYDCQEDSYDYYDSDDYGYESEYDCEDNWYNDYETQDDWSYETEDDWSYETEDDWSYETEDDWSYETEDDYSYETEDDWSYDYESEDDWSDDYEYQENTYDYDYYYDD